MNTIVIIGTILVSCISIFLSITTLYNTKKMKVAQKSLEETQHQLKDLAWYSGVEKDDNPEIAKKYEVLKREEKDFLKDLDYHDGTKKEDNPDTSKKDEPHKAIQEMDFFIDLENLYKRNRR